MKTTKILAGIIIAFVAVEVRGSSVGICTPKERIVKEGVELLGTKKKAYYWLKTRICFEPRWEYENPFEVNIWFPSGYSFPGNNRQIIEIYKDGQRVSFKEVGGQPVPLDAWGTYALGTCYIYIKCKHILRDSDGVYIYKVDTNYKIEFESVYFSKKDLRKAEGLLGEKEEKLSGAEELPSIPKDPRLPPPGDYKIPLWGAPSLYVTVRIKGKQARIIESKNPKHVGASATLKPENKGLMVGFLKQTGPRWYSNSPIGLTQFWLWDESGRLITAAYSGRLGEPTSTERKIK